MTLYSNKRLQIQYLVSTYFKTPATFDIKLSRCIIVFLVQCYCLAFPRSRKYSDPVFDVILQKINIKTAT